MPQVPLADGIYPWVLYLKNLYLFLKTNPGSSVLLPGKSHGRRSLVGCSREESDMAERLHFHFSLSCIWKEMATHSSVLAKRIPGMGEPGGLLSMGSHRVRSDLAAAAVVKNPPAKTGDTSLIPDPGRSHEPWSNKAHVPQLPSLPATTAEAHRPGTRAPQQ